MRNVLKIKMDVKFLHHIISRLGATGIQNGRFWTKNLIFFKSSQTSQEIEVMGINVEFHTKKNGNNDKKLRLSFESGSNPGRKYLYGVYSLFLHKYIDK